MFVFGGTFFRAAIVIACPAGNVKRKLLSSAERIGSCK
jgi:hypothetical protein